MNQKILLLPSFRDLTEFVERRQNVIVNLERNEGVAVILFAGSNLERQMFEELIQAYLGNHNRIDEMYASIKSHYERMIETLRGDTRYLETMAEDELGSLNSFLKGAAKGSAVGIRNYVQGIQLRLGSAFATHALNLKEYSWVDARDIFWVENRENPDWSGKMLAGQLKLLLGEDQSILPIVTQAGLAGGEGEETFLIEDYQTLLEAACKLAGIGLVIQ